MIKIQVQTHIGTEVSKYTTYVSEVIPSIGHTLKIGDNRFTVTSVTWFIPEYRSDEPITEVYVQAELQ